MFKTFCFALYSSNNRIRQSILPEFIRQHYMYKNTVGILLYPRTSKTLPLLCQVMNPQIPMTNLSDNLALAVRKLYDLMGEVRDLPVALELSSNNLRDMDTI